MRRLALLLLLIPTILLPQASWHVVTVPYKADNLNFFTGNGSTYFNVTLTGNVNTSGLNGGSDGMEAIFHICQDNVGGRTFNWPPNVANPPTINSAANSCTDTRFVNIGNFTWNNTGVGNGTGAITTPPGGSPVQTQVNNGGVFGGAACESFVNKDTGPENVDCDWHSKGPNPYVDVTRYGVRSLAPTTTPVAVGITASINATSTSATVSTSTCAGQTGSVCFVNGDGVVIYGAGPTHSLTTPGAPTVTPSVAIAGTGTGFVANGPTGATTYCYKIIARTKNGGLTAASTETCTTTGAATLGVPTPVSISSISRSNDVVSVTTSAAHGFLVGCNVVTCGEVYITGVVDAGGDNLRTFDGWWAVATAVDSTHFTFTGAQDTRTGGTVAGSGGTAQWFNCNHVTWPQVTNAWEYYIYAGASGAETLRGVSRPQGVTNIDLTWDDFGSPMMDNFLLPPFVPNTPPSSATSDHLVTTIVSGAGTTTLTLANAASTTVAGATIRLDNAPNIKAAANDISSRSTQGIQGGSLYFPLDGSSGNNFYPINSFLDLSSLNAVPIMQTGQIWLNETWQLAAGTKWFGDRLLTKGQGGSFAFQNNPLVTVNTAIPGVYLTTINQSNLTGVSFTGAALNGELLFFGEGQFSFQFHNDVFVTNTGTSDYMGIGLYLRGGAGQSAAAGIFDTLKLTTGNTSPTQDGFTHTPALFCNSCGSNRMTNLFFSERGIFYVGNSAGGNNVTLDWGYTQGAVQPFFTVTQMFQGSVRLSNITSDSSIHPYFVALPSAGSVSPGSLVFGDTQQTILNGFASSPLTITGLRLPTVGPVGITGGGQSSTPQRSSGGFISGSTNDGTLGNDAFYSALASQGAVIAGPLYPMFVENNTTAAPTCAVSAGGTVTLGTYKFRVVPVWWNGSDGVSSLPSATCTTTGGNQTLTVSWTAPSVAPKSYTVYASTGGGYGTATTGLTTTSIVYSTGTPGNGGIVEGGIPSGGPTMLMPGAQGIATPLLLVSGSIGGANSISSLATAPRTGAFPDVSGVIPLTTYLNTAYENCNRADGAIGSNWTAALNSLNCLTNQIKGNVGADNTMYWTGSPLSVSSGQFSQVVLTTLGARSGPTVFTTATGGYACVETTTTLAIFNITNGALNSQLASVGITGNNGDVVRFEVRPGTNPDLNCFINGVSTLTVNDTAFTSGSPGLNIFSTAVRADNWSGGNLHPIAQLDTEQDWTQPQHFIQPVTIGPTNPVAGALTTGLSASQINLYSGANVANMTWLAQNATGNPLLSTSSTPSAKFLDCQNTSTCAQANVSSPLFFIKGGPVAMSTGTVAIGSLPFTSSTSYVCTVNDVTATNPVQVVYTSGATVTFNGTTTDSIRYICWGI